MMETKKVTPQQVKEMFHDGDELALIDVREQGAFSKEHMLLACCIPFSHMEFKIGDLVPRETTRIVLVDGVPADTSRLSERAAERLHGFGYSDISVIEGGVSAWRAVGFELFSGVNVLSKAFGEFVEAAYDTPKVTAEELKSVVDSDQKVIILDSRPEGEYHRMCIPGGIDTPGAELVYRVHDLTPDPETMVVVNCAGRTRSIIGAQSLINAGIPNPVAALKGGTMGWQLAGFQMEHDQDRHAPHPSPAGLSKARACAVRVTDRFGVKKIGGDTLKAWMTETDIRTLFLLDVRLPGEFEAGHLKEARNAPGGQLIQATDEYVAVRNARLVLVDDTEVRAVMTASWLVQMGWRDVYVLSGGIGNAPLVRGPNIPRIFGPEKADPITPLELKEMLDSGESVAVVDLSKSIQYRCRHIPGSWWGVRSRLASGLKRLMPADCLVLISQDDRVAHLAVKDVRAILPAMPIRVLEGGTESWVKAGLPTAEGLEHVLCEIDDVWYKPYEHKDAPQEAMREYLTWEVALVGQIERDGDAGFRLPEIGQSFSD
jgi:rhodanese-related sulfurtransferase